ncbi:hypothetical protein IPG36_05265 [bacterium]|nr:MAG: hypothetical protein IPG36_05265 [bacterium]
MIDDKSIRITKGYLLHQIETDLQQIGFIARNKILSYQNNEIEIELSLELNKSSDEQFKGDINFKEVYIKFLAQPKKFKITDLHLWPGAMDLQFIVSNMAGQSQLQQPYILSSREPYFSSKLHHDISIYARNFFLKIQSMDGYLDFLLRKNKNIYDIQQIDYSDVLLISIALVISNKLKLYKYEEEAADIINKILNSPKSTAYEYLNRILNTNNRYQELLKKYS